MTTSALSLTPQQQATERFADFSNAAVSLGDSETATPKSMEKWARPSVPSALRQQASEGAAHFSPFSTAAVSFGDLETATPKSLAAMVRPTASLAIRRPAYEGAA